MGESVQLRSGNLMPLNGFGTWKAEQDVTKNAVLNALQVGYRHIDCAAVYLNEKAVGEAFAEAFASGLVKREELFVTSKVWNSCHDTKKVVEACEQSIKDLGVGYLDLYLVHHPFSWEFGGLPITEESWVCRDEDGKIKWGKGVTLEMTWRGMEECVKQGLCRDIGVSNYSVMLIMDLLQYCSIKPSVNQCEAHIYNTRTDLRSICEEFGIHFTMYSILGSGKEGPLQDKTVEDMAKTKGCSVSGILISWGLHHRCSVLAKSTNEKRIQDNFKASEIELSKEEMAKLDGLDQRLIVCNMAEYWGFASHA